MIRTGVDLAMRMLGKQFVTGETIEEALKSAVQREARGYRFSYDMLGEAAMTAADAAALLPLLRGRRSMPSVGRAPGAASMPALASR